MQQLTQLIKPSILLDNTTYKQNFLELARDGKRCALGVIFGDLPGWSLDDHGGFFHNGKHLFRYVQEMADCLGQSNERIDCPLCMHGDSLLPGIIMHLNDGHKLSFKEIAIWLRAIGY